jgi:DNA-binding transcriptional LysR family regulator
VLEGAELGFIEGALDEPALADRNVGEDRLLLVSATPVEQVDEAWIAAPWILREAGSGTRSSFEAVLRARGCDPGALQAAMVLPSNEAVLSAVECGAGVAALSELVVGRALAAAALFALPFAMPARPFQAIHHKERHQTRAARAMIDLLAQERLP